MLFIDEFAESRRDAVANVPAQRAAKSNYTKPLRACEQVAFHAWRMVAFLGLIAALTFEFDQRRQRALGCSRSLWVTGCLACNEEGGA